MSLEKQSLINRGFKEWTDSWWRRDQRSDVRDFAPEGNLVLELGRGWKHQALAEKEGLGLFMSIQGEAAGDLLERQIGLPHQGRVQGCVPHAVSRDPTLRGALSWVPCSVIAILKCLVIFEQESYIFIVHWAPHVMWLSCPHPCHLTGVSPALCLSRPLYPRPRWHTINLGNEKVLSSVLAVK